MTVHCLEITRNFIAEAPANVQIVGGVGSFALAQASEILLDERLIVVHDDDIDYSSISQRRDNGSLRDFDVLVRSADPAAVATVEAAAHNAIGGQLDISVFGLHTMSELEKQIDHPLDSLSRVWLGDRYIETNLDGEITRGSRALFPFAVDMPLESLETWHVEIGANANVGSGSIRIPVANPGATVLNYATRSISGVRTKDNEKLNIMARRIFELQPEIVDWIIDGPGSSQLALASVLHTLRSPANGRSMQIGGKLPVDILPGGSLRNHPAMMLRDNPPLARLAASVSRNKARLLHTVESHPQLVGFFQRKVEKRISGVVKNT